MLAHVHTHTHAHSNFIRLPKETDLEINKNIYQINYIKDTKICTKHSITAHFNGRELIN